MMVIDLVSPSFLASLSGLLAIMTASSSVARGISAGLPGSGGRPGVGAGYLSPLRTLVVVPARVHCKAG